VSGALEITVARTIDEVEVLRPAWEVLQGTELTTDLDYFLTVLRHDPRVTRPHVLLAHRDGEPHGLVVGRLQDARLRCRLGYRKLYEPPVRTLIVVPGGFLGAAADLDPLPLLDALRRSVGRREVDAVHLPSVRLGSPLGTALAHGTRRTGRSVAAPRAHWTMRVPSAFEDFLGSLSSSTRQGVRRYANKLERVHADTLELDRVTTLDGLDRFFGDAAAVARTTYQHGLGVGVREDDELQRALVALGMERGWFRAHVLSLEGSPAAFWHGYGYRGIFRTMVPGFDPTYGSLNIGTYVLAKLIEDLCADPAIHTLDFGLGDAEYKRRFGDSSWDEQDVVVFSPSFRAQRIHAVRSVLLAGVGVGRRIGERGSAGARVKKAWRRRIATTGNARPAP
jgi:hypothetical protein